MRVWVLISSMDTQQVANRLHELCSAGQYHEAMEELYADDAKHIEAMAMPGQDQILEGKPALLKMSEHWGKTNTVHEQSVGTPLVNGDQFLCQMSMDLTMGDGPMAGQRAQMSEWCLYTVADGKIKEARFFYAPC